MNDGGTVAANTYINLTTGGGLPNGEVQVSDEHWGVMRVDLSSCLEGTLTYRSDLPFGHHGGVVHLLLQD